MKNGRLNGYVPPAPPPPPAPPAAPMPSFTVWIQPGNASTGDIKALLDALSDLHRACGGVGMTFTKVNS